MVSEGAARTLTPGEEARRDAALANSPEVKRLIRIRDEITIRARSRGVTPEMVRAAYRGGDARAASELLGFSEEETAALNRRLTRARDELYRKHPLLRAVAVGEVRPGEACGAEHAARALAAGASGPPDGAVLMETSSDRCKWLQYTAALAVCTTVGPVLYWPCAYLAYCSFCTDEVKVCV